MHRGPQQVLEILLAFSLAAVPAISAGNRAASLPQGAGLAAKYRGDAGIEADPAVVFVENFEVDEIEDFRARWSHINNKAGKALAVTRDAPEGSRGTRSLRMTATRGENEGGHLYRLLQPGYQRLFLRFYVRFAEDNGYNHHFVSLGGEIDPAPYPIGRAGRRAVNRWNSGIEPAGTWSQTSPRTHFPPPGIWQFYTYWPDMRSFQNEDGSGTVFYGNEFTPEKPVPAERGRWIAVEVMVKMNSSPEASDGEQAFWIDGRLAGHFGPGTLRGRWSRALFRRDAGGEPFEGFRWRDDERVSINKLWLSHYVSEAAFKRTDAWAARNPEAKVNRGSATVWFDDLVVATEYIGPLGR